MEIWRAPARGELSRAELADLKVHNTLFTTFYVQIVALLKENYGVARAINALREIGEGVAFSMWNFKKPKKTNSLKKIISEVSNFGFYKSVSFQTREDGLLVIDKDCSICWEGVLEKDIPYCCIIDGFLEKYLLLAFDDGYDIPKVQVRVIKSKATGDEQCEHLVTSF